MKGEEKINEQSTTGQHIYRIRVYKDFDFPSFSIDKNNRLTDLAARISDEVRDHFENEGYFEMELINVLPFNLRDEKKYTTGNMDYDFFIREISLEATKEKYGDLSFDKNPDLYEKGQHSETSVTFNLKPEIEDFFITNIRKYTNLFSNKRIDETY